MNSNKISGKECISLGAQDLTFEAYANRRTNLGELAISRALPIRNRRMIGPWCFLDRFGPMTFSASKPMNVPPHPHIGLQTVTWLLQGEILHTDSIDSEAIVRPGGVNVMTAGAGIAHAEKTPVKNNGVLNGVQLWVALPDSHRHTSPSFASIEKVPVIERQAGTLQLIAGKFSNHELSEHYYSEIIGLGIKIHPGKTLEFDLDPAFEHAMLLLEGDCSFEGQKLEQEMLYYFGTCRNNISLSTQNGGQLLLVGGPPFPEKILMWWNFIARTPDEIAKARADWEETNSFGTVRGMHQTRLSAPSLARFAQPNPAS
ncbi:MAG: pirin family protein [Brevefilum sp.]|nr:pirin family protein [Brevefilum sp.]MDW7755700.1 pirin family protein [Brevefilum sp.]